MKCKKIFFNYKSHLPIFKKKFDGEIQRLHHAKISYYIPSIIKKLIYTIPKKYNNFYIVCPYYNNHEDFQIGVTETSKYNENEIQTIKRGINEEVGLEVTQYYRQNLLEIHQHRKKWTGLSISKNIKYNPNTYINHNQDNKINKVGVIIFNDLDYLINIYKNLKENDIKSDDIQSIGFISVFDCKKIINNNIHDTPEYNHQN